jgi:hypothetical protein
MAMGREVGGAVEKGEGIWQTGSEAAGAGGEEEG